MAVVRDFSRTTSSSSSSAIILKQGVLFTASEGAPPPPEPELTASHSPPAVYSHVLHLPGRHFDTCADGRGQLGLDGRAQRHHGGRQRHHRRPRRRHSRVPERGMLLGRTPPPARCTLGQPNFILTTTYHYPQHNALAARPRCSRLIHARVPRFRSRSSVLGAVAAVFGPPVRGRGWPARVHIGRCRRLQAATGARRSPAAARRQRPASVARAERACCRRQHAGRPRDRLARVVRARRSGPGERSGRPGPRGASGGSGAAAGGMGPARRCPRAPPVVPDAPGTHVWGAHVHLYAHICPGSSE